MAAGTFDNTKLYIEEAPTVPLIPLFVDILSLIAVRVIVYLPRKFKLSGKLKTAVPVPVWVSVILL